MYQLFDSNASALMGLYIGRPASSFHQLSLLLSPDVNRPISSSLASDADAQRHPAFPTRVVFMHIFRRPADQGLAVSFLQALPWLVCNIGCSNNTVCRHFFIIVSNRHKSPSSFILFVICFCLVKSSDRPLVRGCEACYLQGVFYRM